MENILLIDITTFDPEMVMEVSKRWEMMESMEFPKGLKIINQWFDAGGGRIVTLYYVESVKDYATYNFLFSDLCHVEVFPVVGAEEFKKFAFKCIENLTAGSSLMDA